MRDFYPRIDPRSNSDDGYGDHRDDWIDITAIGSRFEEQVTGQAPVEHRHRKIGDHIWLEGPPPRRN